MPDALKHPVTGCRYDTLLGDWMIIPDQLEAFVEAGWAIVEKGELEAFKLRSESQHAALEEKPYEVIDGIAHMTISGPMTKLPTSMSSLFGGTSTILFRKALNKVALDTSVKGIFIEMDSGGGTAEGTAELVSAIAEMDKVKPVFIHAPDTMASAAMWAGAPARRLTCGPMAMVGSVGALVELSDPSAGDKKPVVITSGKYKGIGRGPLTAEQKTELERHVNQLAAVFWGDVAKFRPMTVTHKAEILTARIFIGADAMRVGLVDGVCMTKDALEYAKNYINNPTPVRRGSGVKANHLTAPTRSIVMPLSAQQIEQLRKLPGADNVTEENADSVALNVATNASSQLATSLRTQTALQTQVTALEGQINTLKASAPQKMDPSLLRGHAGLAFQLLKTRLTAGKITTVQYERMSKALLTKGEFKDGKLSADAIVNEPMFAELSDGTRQYESVFSVFDENAPNGLMNNVSKDQPAPRTEPGAGGNLSDKPQKEVTLASQNALRIQHGEKPLTRETFDVIFPEYAGK